MFPFLSVLCCIIGVLTLFLVIMLGTRVISAEKQIVELGKPPPEPVRRRHGLEDGIDDATYDALDQQAARLAGELAQREQDRVVLERMLQDLEALIELKRDEIAASPSRKPPVLQPLDQPDRVRPVPETDPSINVFRVVKKPVFIEISADGYLVQPSKQKFPRLVAKDDKSPLEFGPELKRFLTASHGKRGKEYLLLLIHPNGSKAYDEFRAALGKDFNKADAKPGEKIDVGIEPFSRDWEFVGSLNE